MRYDAFISYNHGADGGIAPYLQDALQRIAMPWYRRRGMEVFRDYTDLPADADLAEAIETGLDESRYYVLLASPGSRDSQWVGQEIDHWLATKTAARKRIVLVLTDGEVVLDDSRQIDYDRSTALHEQMRGRFREAPLYIDLSSARQKIDEGTLSRRQFRREYRHDIALTAAKIKEVSVRDVIDEDAKFQHRKLTLAWSAAAMLLLLVIASVVLAVIARNNADEARTQARNARSLGLASQSSTATAQDAPQALALALASRHEAKTDLGRRALQSAVADPIWRVYGPAVIASYAPSAPTAMSPQGRVFAAGDAGDTIMVWDSQAGTTDTLTAPNAYTSTAVAIDREGTRVAATFLVDAKGQPDGIASRLVVWDRATGETVAHDNVAGTINSLAYAPASATLAAGDDEGNVLLWPGGQAPARTLPTGFPSVTSVSFSPDGRSVAATTESPDSDPTAGSIVVFDAASEQRIATIPIGSPVAVAGAWDADGTTFFTGDVDGKVTHWNLASGATIASWTDNGPVVSVAVSPTAPLVVSGSSNGEVVVRDSDTGAQRASWNEGTLVTSIGFSESGRRLATGNDRGRVTVRDTTRLPNSSTAHGTVQSLAFAADDSRVVALAAQQSASGSPDGVVSMLDLDTNNSESILDGARPQRIAVNARGTLAALVETVPDPGNTRSHVTIVDLGTRAAISGWDVDGVLLELAFVDGKHALGVVEKNGKDRLVGWNVRDGSVAGGSPIDPIARADGQARGSLVAVSGNRLAMVDKRQRIIVENVATHQTSWLPARGRKTYGIMLTRDGGKLAALVGPAGQDSVTAVEVSDLTTGTIHPVVTNTHGGTPTAAAFSRDGTKLAVGDDKARVTLYDLRDYHVVTEWDVSGAVTSLAFSPDGTRLAAADAFGRIEVWESSSWDASDADLMRTLCRRLASFAQNPVDWKALDPYSLPSDLCPAVG